MFKRLIAPALIVSCASLALAQPDVGSKKTDPKKDASTTSKKVQPPEKTTEPKKQPANVTLAVGNQAPAIAVQKWVKGKEVTGFEKGKVYVVEFWATWCGPCKASIPHLTEVQKAHKDVTVIGVASSEKIDSKDNGKDNRLVNLEKFVKEQGANMDYTVAFDGERKMATTWLQAAGRNGIPAAFIVNGEGKIAWIGHPMDKGFEEELNKLSKPSTTTKETPAKETPTKDTGKSGKGLKKDKK